MATIQPTVELHEAKVWTCDNCGRDHFLRIACLPDPGVRMVEIDGELVECVSGNMIIPPTVTCPDCHIEYGAECPFDGPDECH